MVERSPSTEGDNTCLSEAGQAIAALEAQYRVLVSLAGIAAAAVVSLTALVTGRDGVIVGAACTVIGAIAGAMHQAARYKRSERKG